MHTMIFSFRRRPILAVLVVLVLAACGGGNQGPPSTVEGKEPDGTVTMRQVQAAYIGSGSAGSGVLYFRGNTYPFTVGGFGIGGIGVSTIEAEGEVYGLKNVYQFPGAYAQGRYGFAFGNKSGGDLWLQNESGVVLHLHAKREGFMLSLGGDAVVIQMK